MKIKIYIIKALKWILRPIYKLEKKALISAIVISLICVSYYSLFVWLTNQILSVQIPAIHYTPQVIHKAEAKITRPEYMNSIQYIVYKFGNKSDIALAIVKCESNFNEHAINKNKDKEGTFDLGLWQLNEKWQLKPRGISRAEAFNPHKSTDIAYQIYTEQKGFQAWSCYKSNKYKNYLT